MNEQVKNQGVRSAEGLERATCAEELKIEQEKGSKFSKGADRFEERSKSSDGVSAGDKQ